MSKAVLISIQPKWCELIASGKKTVEVRKTKPKFDTPFKCYIYCTKVTDRLLYRSSYNDVIRTTKIKYIHGIERNNTVLNGKVIGEFVCDSIFPISVYYDNPNCKLALKEFPYVCLTDKQIIDYLGNGKQGYGWHISDLKIYDKPKELGELQTICNRSGNTEDKICRNCKNLYFDSDPINGYTRWCGTFNRKHLERPPQSWCYVEELSV